VATRSVRGSHTHQRAERVRHSSSAVPTLKTGRVFQLRGEHDAFVDGDKRYLQFFGKGTVGDGYYSLDFSEVHFLLGIREATYVARHRKVAAKDDTLVRS
jgi:hypothetical protein